MIRRTFPVLVAVLILSVACGKDKSPTGPSTTTPPPTQTPPPTPPPPAPEPPPPLARYAVFGVVRDANTNTPIPGVRVGAVNVQTQTNVSTMTDGGGFYHLAGIATGPVTVDWTHANYTSRSERLTFASADVRHDTTLSPRPPPTPQVEYRITGSARRCSVTYQSSAGGISQASVAIPWSFNRSARTGEFLYVSCQIDTGGDNGSITVAIYKNGSFYRSGMASGFPNIATASGSY
jgi:hypothetical protein